MTIHHINRIMNLFQFSSIIKSIFIYRIVPYISKNFQEYDRIDFSRFVYLDLSVGLFGTSTCDEKRSRAEYHDRRESLANTNSTWWLHVESAALTFLLGNAILQLPRQGIRLLSLRFINIDEWIKRYNI